MKRPERLGAASLGAALALSTMAAFAQVPPHPPGTICFTPKFWCWAARRGTPGGACSCASPYGPVGGTLG